MVRRTLLLHCLIIFAIASVPCLGQDTKENAEFKLAVGLYNDGLYGQAEDQFKRFIDKFPNTASSIEARFYLGLVQQKGFHPVKISWEDIGRYEGSVWGDRISDVGIWVREDERDPKTARLALSVRRDGNFRDKVLVVPASAIKVHRRVRGRTVETTLPERLAELGLASASRDRNVIVSNQFAIVPVPARGMRGAWPDGVPPRASTPSAGFVSLQSAIEPSRSVCYSGARAYASSTLMV